MASDAAPALNSDVDSEYIAAMLAEDAVSRSDHGESNTNRPPPPASYERVVSHYQVGEHSRAHSRSSLLGSSPPAPKRRRGSLADLARQEPSGKQPGDNDSSGPDAAAEVGTSRNLSDMRDMPRPGEVSLQEEHQAEVEEDDHEEKDPASFMVELGGGGRTSIIKNPDDLLKLEKPVSWTSPGPRTLRDAVIATGSPQALRLFDSIWDVVQDCGYLPRELKHILGEELMAHRSRFATEDRAVHVGQKEMDDIHRLFPALGAGRGGEGQLPVVLALYGELKAIREIVTATSRFRNRSRSTAAWNDHIHGPLLRLATSSTPHVGAENITRATIAKPLVPAVRGEFRALGGNERIDYAMLLRPATHLAVRIADFVNSQGDPRTYNVSTHGVLPFEPMGVFVAAKAGTEQLGEAKANLGMWIAAWYGRVAGFAPLPYDVGGGGGGSTPAELPFLPVLLVVGEHWELHLAFHGDSEIEVCGPLQIGNSMSVDGTYRLLAVLRLLAGWVTGEFREWVEACVL